MTSLSPRVLMPPSANVVGVHLRLLRCLYPYLLFRSYDDAPFGRFRLKKAMHECRATVTRLLATLGVALILRHRCIVIIYCEMSSTDRLTDHWVAPVSLYRILILGNRRLTFSEQYFFRSKNTVRGRQLVHQNFACICSCLLLLFIYFADCIITVHIYSSTHNSLQACVSLRHYTVTT